MNIVIIADTDKKGKSGVGDFALLLADSLRVLNLNVVFEVLGPPDHSSRLALGERVRRAQPDWVSLHFVPYAYAHRGLVSKHTLPWEQLRGIVGTHILFHEIWIGAHQAASLKQRAIGYIQRRGIQEALGVLRPNVVHCTNSLYSALLQRADIPNKILPLFGNIPVLNNGSSPYSNLLDDLVQGSERADWVVACLFGTIYESVNLLPFIRWLKNKCLAQGKHLLVVSLGHCSTATITFERLASCFAPYNMPYFHVTGKLDECELSYWIRGADCGLATTPFNIIDKSSTAVAFVEHGIPIIVMDAGAPLRGMPRIQPDLAPEFWLFGDSRLEKLQLLPPRREPRSRRDYVVNQFLSDLRINIH